MEREGKERVIWNDVAGYESVKARLDDILAHVLQRADLAARGLPLTAGLMLEGLPGCGKSTIAHAIGGPDGLFVSPGQIRGPTPDISVANLHAAFEQVNKAGPGVLVLDDLDLLVGSGVADECARRISTELRSQLEFAPVSGIFVVGCVRLASALPSGLRRAGRFDHHLSLMPPGPNDRRTIVQHHVTMLPGLELGKTVDLHAFANATPLMTGADLAAIVRNAARRAMTHELDHIVIEQAHLLTALRHHRRSLTVLEVERWLDAVRKHPGNEDAALMLERDIEACKTGRGDLAAMDVSELLPERDENAPTPREDDVFDARNTLVSTVAPDPGWDPNPTRRRSTTQIMEAPPDPAWDPQADGTKKGS